MSIPAIIALEAVEAEMPAVAQYVAAAGLELDRAALGEQTLLFYVTFINMSAARFVVELDCTDYPMYPPTIEFVPATPANLARGASSPPERGTRSLYPSCFHPMPCVCMRYNRKAYAVSGGPHGDWRMVDWQLPTGSAIAIDTLTLIVSDLHSKIASSTGRLGV